MADKVYMAGGRNVGSYDQTIMKTVTLGLAPWIPTFSQAYGLEVKGQTGGTIEEGFFTVAPQSRKGGDPNWATILDDYFTNVSGDGERGYKELAEAGRNMNIDRMLSPLAQKLTTILDSLGQISYPAKTAIATEIGEIETEIGLNELKKIAKTLGDKAGVSPIDKKASQIIGGGAGGKGSAMGIDIRRDQDTEIMFTVMKKLFTDLNLDYTVGLEVTQTQTKKEIQAGIGTKTKYERAYGLLQENLGLRGGGAKPIAHFHTFKRINSMLEIIFKGLPKKIRESKNVTKKLEAIYSVSKLNKKDEVAVAKVAGYMGLDDTKPITNDNVIKFNTFLRQVIDRFLKISVAGLPVDFDNYAYMVPVGNTGYMAVATFMMNWTKEGYPQIVAKNLQSFNLHIKERGVSAIDLLRVWATDTIGKNAAAQITTYADIHEMACNQYFLSASKAAVIDNMLVATMDGQLADGATDVQIDMWKAYKGKGDKDYIGEPSAIAKILPSEMTEGLRAQFESIQKGEAGKELSKAMIKIFELSNKTTNLWKDMFDSSKYSEYVRGQNELSRGIWTIPPWGAGTTDPTGLGPSMTPYIASQAGPAVARVSPKAYEKVGIKDKRFTQDPERIKSFIADTGWGVSPSGRGMDADKATFRGFFAGR